MCSHGALQISNGIWDLGGIRMPLLICLVGCWVLVFLCLLRGVRSLGRVVWFTVLAPYVFLVVILVRGVFLDGAIDGIYYFVFPRLEKLLDIKVFNSIRIRIRCASQYITLFTALLVCKQNSLLHHISSPSTHVKCMFIVYHLWIVINMMAIAFSDL